MTDSEIRSKILDTTARLFEERGLKFTMDELASSLSMSKKTIYVHFPDKKTLLDEMVERTFDMINARQREVLGDPALTLTEKLRGVLTAMPEALAGLDLRALHTLKDKYPRLYRRVEQRLESGWEPTLDLLEEGIRTGVFRDVPLPVFRTIYQASLEQFFQRDVLISCGLSYQEGLRAVTDILIDGITVSAEGAPETAGAR